MGAILLKRVMRWGGHQLEFGANTLIMGIVNVTPDSFSDGGAFFNVDRAVRHGMRLVEEGADLLDVGGESTRPGYTLIGTSEECRRVVPVIERLASQVKVPISIDTQKSEVAEQAIRAGASIINDIWGCKGDTMMGETAAHHEVPIILMHNRSTPCEENFMETLLSELRQSIDLAVRAGVSRDRMILDPGVGFGKTFLQNLEAIRKLDELTSLGFPILLGTSRKSVIGNTLRLPTDQREEGTAATVAIGITKGADIVRVHDVRVMARVVKMADAVARGVLT